MFRRLRTFAQWLSFKQLVLKIARSNLWTKTFHEKIQEDCKQTVEKLYNVRELPYSNHSTTYYTQENSFLISIYFTCV